MMKLHLCFEAQHLRDRFMEQEQKATGNALLEAACFFSEIDSEFFQKHMQKWLHTASDSGGVAEKPFFG